MTSGESGGEGRSIGLGLQVLLRRVRPHQWKYDYIRLRVMATLSIRNMLSKAPVVDSSSEVVICVATQPSRAKVAFLAVESMVFGSVKPKRLMLWVDDAGLSKNLPASLRRLVKRGLEVRVSESFGPHTKYYPYVASEDRDNCALVLADDDTLYPREWLRVLVDEWRNRPFEVHCHRAQVMRMEGPGRIAPYAAWPNTSSRRPSLAHFATASSGVIYPPHFLKTVRDEGAVFMECCPRADDVWLHRLSLRAGIGVSQVQDVAANFPVIPGTDRGGLAARNVEGGENDVQISLTYDATDRGRLWDALRQLEEVREGAI